MVTMEDTQERVLTSHDRCDHQGCSAQAYFLTIFDSGELNWCHHHFRKNEVMLRDQAYYVLDQSKDLV